MTINSLQITPIPSKIGIICLGVFNVLTIIAVFIINCDFLYKLFLMILIIIANYLTIKHLFTNLNNKIDILMHNMQIVTWEQNRAHMWKITNVSSSGFILMILHLEREKQTKTLPIFIDSIPYSQYRMLRSKILWNN